MGRGMGMGMETQGKIIITAIMVVWVVWLLCKFKKDDDDDGPWGEGKINCN